MVALLRTALLLLPFVTTLTTASFVEEDLNDWAIGGFNAPSDSPDDIGVTALLVNQISRQNNATLLWGPYRPQVYFGVKPRLPDSLIAGLMWAGVDDFQNFQKGFRHTCEQADELDGYGWEEYDVRTGGRQVVRDRGNGVDLQMEWRKVEGGSEGGHWGVRVTGTVRKDGKR